MGRLDEIDPRKTGAQIADMLKRDPLVRDWVRDTARRVRPISEGGEGKVFEHGGVLIWDPATKKVSIGYIEGTEKKNPDGNTLRGTPYYTPDIWGTAKAAIEKIKSETRGSKCPRRKIIGWVHTHGERKAMSGGDRGFTRQWVAGRGRDKEEQEILNSSRPYMVKGVGEDDGYFFLGSVAFRDGPNVGVEVVKGNTKGAIFGMPKWRK